METYGESFANVSGSILESDPTLTEEINNDTSCLQGLVASLATYKQKIDAEARRWLNNMSPLTAEIDVLEQCYGVRYGILRRQATSTIYTCSVDITEPTTLEPEIDTYTDNLQRLNSIGEPFVATFTPTKIYQFNNSGTYQIQVQCQQTGAITCNENSLTTILKPRAGLSSITNTSIVYLGTDLETKQHYQARIAQYIFYGQGQNGTGDSIVKALESDNINGGGCTRAVVYDNTGTSLLHNKIPMGTTCIVCYGGTEDNIFNCLEKQKLYGAFYGDAIIGRTKYVQKDGFVDIYGNVVSGDTYPITYNVAKTQLFDINIELSGNQLAEQDAFIEYVETYITTHRICDFMKTIKKQDLIFCILSYLTENKITNTAFSNVNFTKNSQTVQEVEPADCFTFNVLSQINISYV